MDRNKRERVTVYIDGNNFYKYLKDKEISFPKGVKFDFSKLLSKDNIENFKEKRLL